MGYGVLHEKLFTGIGFYSGGHLKRDGKNVSFCVSATTEIMKTNNVPLISPIKLLPEMKKIFLKCSKFVGFKDLF